MLDLQIFLLVNRESTKIFNSEDLLLLIVHSVSIHLYLHVTHAGRKKNVC